MLKVEKVCFKLRKCAKSWESIRKRTKTLESVPKVEKVEKVLGGAVKAIPSTAAAVKKLINCLNYKIVCDFLMSRITYLLD